MQNASATGGLRGGNIQGALAEYRPQILSQLIESQFGKLGQITNVGQSSAVGQASAGQNMAHAIAELFGQRGQAKAGEQIGKGTAIGGVINDTTDIVTGLF